MVAIEMCETMIKIKHEESTDTNIVKTVKSDAYSWHLMYRTILLLNAFLSLGMNDAIQGSTLLDLKDLVDAKISEISFIFMLRSVGSLIGCFLMGAILDKLARFRFLILACSLIVMGVTNSILPYCPSLLAMYVCAFIGGFGIGSLNTAGNVLLLDIWKGRDSGPYMHALHFFYGIGTFLAPVISRPFLVNETDIDEYHVDKEIPTENSTYVFLQVRNKIESSTWTIKTLYPMVSSYAIFLSLGFIFYFIKDTRKGCKYSTEQEKAEKETEKNEMKSRRRKIVLVGLLAVFFFLYVGMELAFGTFISTFSVESNLKFTRPQGSDVTAVFWGSFAATRAIAIFIAIVAKPGLIMWSSFLTCIVGSVSLSVWAESSAAALYFGTALMGIGMASIFATGFLWAEQRINMTNKVGSILIIGNSAGANVFPVLVGQLLETWPMALIHLTTGTVCGCVLMFGVITLVARGAQTGNSEEHENVELKDK